MSFWIKIHDNGADDIKQRVVRGSHELELVAEESRCPTNFDIFPTIPGSSVMTVSNGRVRSLG